MTYSQFDIAAQNRVPWNIGAKIGPKRPFNQKQIWTIRFFLDREERIRDKALFDLAIDSKLRGCDLVELKIGDLVESGQRPARGGPEPGISPGTPQIRNQRTLTICLLLHLSG